MKNRNTIFILLAAIFLTSAILHAAPADLPAQLNDIRNLLKPADSDTPEVKIAKSRFRGIPDPLQSLLDRDQLTRLSDYSPNNLGVDLSAVPGLAEKIETFYKSVKQEAERRDATKISEIQSLLAQTAEQLKNAKKPEDLDDLIHKLSKNKVSDYDNNSKLSAISRDLQSTLQIITYWQSYLLAKETGNNSETRQYLQQISSALTTNPIIPRSYVLRLYASVGPDAPKHTGDNRLETQFALNAATDRLTESGDIEAAMVEIQPFIKTRTPGHDYNILAILNAYDLWKLEPSMSEAEVLAKYRNSVPSSTDLRGYTLTRTYNQTMLNAISRSYGIETPSAKTNSPRKVLETLATSARDKQDWPKLRQAITSLINLNTSIYNNQDVEKYTNDLTLISLLITAEKAERQSDFEAAAAAYIEASSLDGVYLHRDLIDPRSALIRKSHPEVFTKAMQRAQEKQALAEAARKATEAARKAAEAERRQPTIPGYRSQQLETLRPLIQEAVAEFLTPKRLETLKPVEPETKPKKTPERK